MQCAVQCVLHNSSIYPFNVVRELHLRPPPRRRTVLLLPPAAQVKCPTLHRLHAFHKTTISCAMTALQLGHISPRPTNRAPIFVDDQPLYGSSGVVAHARFSQANPPAASVLLRYEHVCLLYTESVGVRTACCWQAAVETMACRSRLHKQPASSIGMAPQHANFCCAVGL